MGLIFTGCTTNWVAERGFPQDHQIVNLDKVNPKLYRGAQPNRNGLAYLQSIGVRNVVNLRDDAFPDEKDTVEALGMTYLPFPMSGVVTPTKKRVDEILAAIEATQGPVFVHCQFGCDRTGTIMACQRIRSGWDNAKALAEAEAYGMSPLLPGLKHFIKEYKP